MKAVLNTRVLTQINTSQHESTRANTSSSQKNVLDESIWVNMSLTQVNLSQLMFSF